MSFKLFGQLIVIGGQVIGKVLSSAYKQALANAAKNPNVTKNVRNDLMCVDEAAKILNVPRQPSREEVLKKYEHLFAVNDRKTGGSFYLQSKIVRAREALESALRESEAGAKKSQ